MTLQKDAASASNDAGTREHFDTSLTQRCSRPVRYRLISPDGKAYAAFRLKEGVKLSDHAYPVNAHKR